MKVVIIETCAGADFSVVAGQTVELPDATAAALVKAGFARADESGPKRAAVREKATRPAPERAVADKG